MSQPAQRGARSGQEIPPERLAVVGSGTVACGLAACALGRGFDVVLLARSEESAQRARTAVENDCERLGQGSAARRLAVSQELAALARSKVAVEAVIEDEFVKADLLRELGLALGGDALIATTTSSLNVAALARACPEPARFFAMHVFTPVPRMPLVELCFPPGSTQATRERATELCRALGKTAIEVPDEPGFVVNRLLFPYLFDAVRLLERTGLEPERIDSCMKLGASHPMGPLELLDFIGLDVAEAIGEAIHADTGDAAHLPPGLITRMVGETRLGRKTGEGFYPYG